HIAFDEGVAYIDLTDMVADRYEQMGADAVKPFFPADFVHTSPDGAALNAQYVLAGIKALHRQNIISVLSPAARAVNPATQPSVVLPKVARTGSPQAVANFLNWPVASDPALPSIYLVGDSTVRNGRGVGDNGQWGWGEALAAYIDPNKANLVNLALGGTTSGSFYVGEWKGVADLLKKGDIVIIQFGTNGGGIELPGIGEETRQSAGRNGQASTSHTYGWFMRQMIADTRAKGATPIVCTLVPRNTWKDGKISRTSAPADWARQIAKDQNTPLLDLYEGAAERYDKLGQAATTAVFADGHVHTNHDGAEILASVVVEQLKGLPQDPVAGYFRDTPAPTW
ncbi:MAG: GDSL-type esterase/lipase family protein, partial [Tepidisphaeraceae bacterium]